MNYGDRLKIAMTEAGIDRKALAEELGVSVQAVGQVLSGNTKSLDAANHTKAFLFLRCDPAWLATGQRRTKAEAHRIAEPTGRSWHWPFQNIEYALVNNLPERDLLLLEGAWLLAGKQLGFSLQKRGRCVNVGARLYQFPVPARTRIPT